MNRLDEASFKTLDFGVGRPLDIFNISSNHVDQTFQVYVSVPDHEPGEKLPVLYHADANFYSGAFPLLAQNLVQGGVPRLILVGVGYPGGDKASNYPLLRQRDLLLLSSEELDEIRNATHHGRTLIPDAWRDFPDMGTGAPKFLKFFTDELFPIIEDRYPVADDRTYFGFSAGCIFGLYTLFTEPGVFNRYVLGSAFKPSLRERARSYLKSNNELRAKLFFSFGVDEPLEGASVLTDLADGFYDFARLLDGARPVGLDYSYRAFLGERHISGWLPCFREGLRAVFDVDPRKP